jgi:hypothetical protein
MHAGHLTSLASLADNASIPTVQRRYRSISRHYSELADRKEQADKSWNSRTHG